MNQRRGRKAKELTDEEKQWIRYSLNRADFTYVKAKTMFTLGKKMENDNIV